MGAGRMSVRVLIADDHPLFRDGLRSLIIDTEGLKLVGEATDGDEAIGIAAAQRPDVVLMDVKMPRMSGIEATRRILAEGHAGAVLVLTMSDDDGSLTAALRAGATGYVLKGAPGAEIVEAIRVVATGRAILGAPIAARMERYFARPHSVATAPAFPQLTGRETEILDLVAAGLSNAEIASTLALSDKTVRNNVSTILMKLAAPTRAVAIVMARDAGLGMT
ncbi:MAG: response regulator transcription factor [Propionicimonas sp.]|nr:response regulator transcription factor [Propionicimonas sp.]MEA5051976.1 response regulator transcription factor [Propionicimonas sp.]